MKESNYEGVTSSRRTAVRRPLVWAALTLCLLASAFVSWWALGKPGFLWGAGFIVGGEKPAARFALPEPTGPHAIGNTELRLLDRGRPDPWTGGDHRELMVTVWYPARDIEDQRLAPYMQPEAASHFERTSLASVGLEPEDVDLEGVRTHAFAEAPVHEEESHPVVLYSPGGGLPRAVGGALVEDLASRGYVVVTIDHTYEAREVEFPGGRVETASLPEDVALEKLISTRVADVRFVLDELETIGEGGNPDAGGKRLPRNLPRALDLSKVGMFGHSAGGFTTAQVMLEDERIDVGANLDGSMKYGAENLGEAAKRGLDRPFMLMGAGVSGPDGLPHTHLRAPDWKSFWSNSTGPRYDLHIPEGEHFSFVDHQAILPQLEEKLGIPDWLLTGAIGTVDPERVVASERAYIGAFFDQHLKDEDRDLLEGPSPHHPDVDFIR